MQKIYNHIQDVLYYYYAAFGSLDKEDLYGLVDSIRTELGQSIKSPLNPYSVIKAYPESLSLQLRTFDSNTLGGFLLKNNPEYHKSWIVLNDVRSQESRKFNCCHELIHFFKDPVGEYTCSTSLRTRKIAEWQANEGAAELLIPYRESIPFIVQEYENALAAPKKWGSLPLALIPNKLAQKYQVSEQIAEYRISNLEYEIFQYRNGTDIEDIKILSKAKQKERSISFPSLSDLFKKERGELDSTPPEMAAEYGKQHNIHFEKESRRNDNISYYGPTDEEKELIDRYILGE